MIKPKKRFSNLNFRVGVFAGELRGNYKLKLITGIEEAARELQIQVIYFSDRFLLKPSYNQEKDKALVFDTAKYADLDGLIVFSTLANRCNDEILSQFLSPFKNIPIITLNLQSSTGNAILSHNSPGFNSLLDHLIKYHKYKKLAFVNGPEHNLDARERFDIYKAALSSAGINYNPHLVAKGNFSYISGREAVQYFLNEQNLKPGKDLDVVLCANDTMACGVVDEFYDLDIMVPHDIAVTGFDNSGGFYFTKHQLTTVNQPFQEIGKQAIYSIMDYKPQQKPLYFDTQLVLNLSCGCSEKDIYSITQKMPDKIWGASDSNKIVRQNHDQETIYYKIISAIDSQKISQKMDELSTWMKNNLPILGIHYARILLTSPSDTDIPTYQCVAGFDMKNPKELISKEIIPENLIFSKFLSKEENHSFCILPLTFQYVKYGFLIIEVQKAAYLIYGSLSHQIGSSIKNIRLSEKVAAMNLQLKQNNEHKTEFFINIAHETKTPLTLIKNYLEEYIAEHGNDNKLNTIKQNFDILLMNMLNFLDVEKLMKGRMIYKHDNFVDLSESIRKKCMIFQAMAAKKKISLEYISGNRILITIDPLALDRILNNLLDNAIKYTQATGLVTVNAWSEEDKSILCITDNGPGLPVKNFEHIFEPYYLLSQKKTKGQGVGVGLSIVKKILDEIGALINVEPGKKGGTSFTITFFNKKVMDNQDKILTIPKNIPIKSQEKIKEIKISPDKISLLIIDDNTQLLNFLQTALSNTYNVYLSESADNALTKLQLIPRPEVIISDVMMAGSDGFQLLSILSSKEAYNDIPFIFLTALGGEKEKLKGLDLGAVDYIEKPFSIAALRSKIDSIIKLRKKQRKQDIREIREKLYALMSESENNISQNGGSNFNHICERYGLTDREQEILKMLKKGMIHKEIASYMNISLRGLRYHISNLYKKCGVNNKSSLLRKLNS